MEKDIEPNIDLINKVSEVVELDDGSSSKSSKAKQPYRGRLESIDSDNNSNIGTDKSPQSAPLDKQKPSEIDSPSFNEGMEISLVLNPSDKNIELESDSSLLSKRAALKKGMAFSFMDNANTRSENLEQKSHFSFDQTNHESVEVEDIQLDTEEPYYKQQQKLQNINQPEDRNWKKKGPQEETSPVELRSSLQIPKQSNILTIQVPKFEPQDLSFKQDRNFLEESLLKWSDLDPEPIKHSTRRSMIRNAPIHNKGVQQKPLKQAQKEQQGQSVAEEKHENTEQEQQTISEYEVQKHGDTVSIRIKTSKGYLWEQIVTEKFVAYLEQYFLIEEKILLPSRYKKLFSSSVKTRVYTEKLFDMIVNRYPNQLMEFISTQVRDSNASPPSQQAETENNSYNLKTFIAALGNTLAFAKNKLKESFKSNYYNSPFYKLHKLLEAKINVSTRIQQARKALSQNLDVQIRESSLEKCSQETMRMLGTLQYLIAFDKAEKVLSYKRDSLPKEPKYRVQIDIFGQILGQFRVVKQEETRKIEQELTPLIKNVFASKHRKFSSQ